MISTDLISILSRPGNRGGASRTGGRRSVESTDADQLDESPSRRSRKLVDGLDLDGPMPVFRRRGYYLDLLI
ncbi:hypothetical protein [Acetobacter sp.]|jgi:hypothetical protein|uniref:hypothetical protein n=1 Tax=Acetobacter sp. TaxID=440 RepID=UPI0025C59500|nr:hypothetical protein [Acetobacter sp.]MCH4089676.1 hypothetical protein [Acetobacter sp.]MCI1300656.1 hypothetical protein [Acetobacter sp.]MCI1317050.1 hypothetical protein [Acetobacter sp.]